MTTVFPVRQKVDWKRAKDVTDTIMNIWLEMPELRLGQLLENAVGRMKVGSPDLFNIEDEELLNALKRLKEQHVEQTG